VASVHLVIVEYRDDTWIREEVESVWSDETKAQERATAINSDYETWPSHVAGVESFGFSDYAISPRRVQIGVGRGGRNPAKLTEVQVRAIRERYAVGDISQAALGEEYGVTRMAVSAIVSRRSWKHVR
jgi:hypothetical protein